MLTLLRSYPGSTSLHPPINRRTLLKASGISLALPFLDSMNPVFGASSSEPPKRMVLVCTALGLHPQHLWPKNPGADWLETDSFGQSSGALDW
jgi:hypothetical protein